MTKEKPDKKIIFSEEIDSRIEGLALGLSFISVGLFLIFVPNFFGNELVGQIVRWIFIIIGTLGLFVEFGKFPSLSGIKGFDDLWVGIILLAIWIALYKLTEHWLGSILGFCCIILGSYSAFRGLFQIVYSIMLNWKKKVINKSSIVSDLLIFLTKVASLVLIVVQVISTALPLL